jgi:hypothetical protein
MQDELNMVVLLMDVLVHLELEVTDDVWSKQAQHIRCTRELEARHNLLYEHAL